jgi:hypothetical protein
MFSFQEPSALGSERKLENRNLKRERAEEEEEQRRV